MVMQDLTEWKWGIISHNDGTVSLDIGNSIQAKSVSLPRICGIDMMKGIITIEERYLKKNNEEGDRINLSLSLASQDAVAWVVTQLTERAKSPY